MRVIAAMVVDMERSPIGTCSRLGDELFGRTILRRTIERALQSRMIAGLHLVVPVNQVARVAPMVSDLDVKIESHAAPPAPYQSLVRAGRVWGLDSWRGGPGGFCSFDEDFHTAILHALAHKLGADAIAAIPSAAPLFDGKMLDAMIRHADDVDEPTGLTFVQAPPGLGAFIIRAAILDQLQPTNVPPGAVLGYQPTNPMADLTGRETCYRPAIEVIHARGRLLCDTHRSTSRVARLLERGAESWESPRISMALAEESISRVEDCPEEIEIELTTDMPTGWQSILRPLGRDAGRRGPVSMTTIDAIANSIGEFDDVQIVLGGFGDPMLHPAFVEICRRLRASKAMAIAVRTTGLVDDVAKEAALFETPLDLVEVTIDAAAPATYARVCGLDAYGRVDAFLERSLARRAGENRVVPLWVPSMVKANETIDDLEPFVDRWQRRLGIYLVTGHSHCAGQLPARVVSSLAPPMRTPCRRVKSRMVVLADGRVTTCDQDFRGVQSIGNLVDTPLREIWRSAKLQSIREKTIADAPLCAACDEWHRP